MKKKEKKNHQEIATLNQSTKALSISSIYPTGHHVLHTQAVDPPIP